MVALDWQFVRAQFPQLSDGWVYLENGGGSLVPQPVIDGITAHLTTTRIQPHTHFAAGAAGWERMEQGRVALAAMVGADPDGFVLGPSTTLNVHVLARALAARVEPGDVVVVTDQDHEANSGAWRRLAEERGAELREWRVDPVTGLLDPADLQPLLAPPGGGSSVRLVCFPQCSNLIGAVNPVAESVERIRAAAPEALAIVDGVAWVGHGAVDVAALGADVYLFSLYKLYGPHLGAMAVRPKVLDLCTNQNHYFHDAGGAKRLNPGGSCYDLAAGVGGVPAYFDALYAHHFGSGDGAGAALSAHARARAVYGVFAVAERLAVAPLASYVASEPRLRVLGPAMDADDGARVPVFGFAVQGGAVDRLAAGLAEHRIACAAGDFYAPRLVARLAEAHGEIDVGRGVLRVSFAHYNTPEECERLIAAFRAVLG